MRAVFRSDSDFFLPIYYLVTLHFLYHIVPVLSAIRKKWNSEGLYTRLCSIEVLKMKNNSNVLGVTN